MTEPPLIVDGHDCALFDLDGVVYLGPEAVPGAVEGLAALTRRGVRVGFVTNNAARPPHVVVEQLRGLGIDAHDGDVVTSAQAGARMVASELPEGSLVLVAGTEALADELREVGMRITTDWRDHPAAVVQGYNPSISWETINSACHAIQHGARWFTTNSDLTRPTDLGLEPGAGAQIAAVRTSVDAEPLEAGKPHPPLLRETIRRLSAVRPIFVGDRLDTDIAGANAIGIDSLLVFTGAHGPAELLDAPEDSRPTHIGLDLRALLAPVRTVTWTGGRCRVGDMTAWAEAGRACLSSVPDTPADTLDALWALCQVVWTTPGLDHGVVGQLDVGR